MFAEPPQGEKKRANKKQPERQESQTKIYKIPLRKIVAPTQSTNHRFPLSDAIRQMGYQVFEKGEGGKAALWDLALSDSMAERAEYAALVTEHDPELAALALGIMTKGLQQPIVVRENGSGNYTIIIGHRRCLAILYLWARGDLKGDNPTIDGRLAKANTSDCLQIGIQENTLRKPPTHYELAEAFQRMVNLGTPIADIAASRGCSEKTVKDHIKILETLEQKDINRFRDGSLKYTKALAMAEGKVAGTEAGSGPPVEKKPSRKVVMAKVKEKLDQETNEKVKEVLSWILDLI